MNIDNPDRPKRFPWSREKRAIFARIDPALHAALDAQSRARGVSISRIVVELITQAVQQTTPATPAEADGSN